MDGEIFAGWTVISRSPHGRIYVMFGPVVTTEAHLAFSGTTEAHLAFSGARTHSNNTAEKTAMIEAFSFLGSRGPVTHDEQSCIFYDSMLAAGICLGTIQARTRVQLALASQQSMIRVQHKLRLTMQHVYGHRGNLGNECADHAAALGTFGLISSHNVASRWTRHNFDASECFDERHSIREILERLQHIQQTLRYHTRTGFSIGFSHRVSCVLCALYVCSCLVSHLLSAIRFCLLWIIAFPTSDGSTLFICVYCNEYRRLLRAQYVESSIGIALPRAREWYRRLLPRGSRPGQDRTLFSLCS